MKTIQKQLSLRRKKKLFRKNRIDINDIEEFIKATNQQ